MASHSGRLHRLPPVAVALGHGADWGTLDELTHHLWEARDFAVVLDGDALEAMLGAPVPTVPLDPPLVDGAGLAFGLLDLEEDVLRDSYALAKDTHDAHVRTWRETVSLAPLATMHQSTRMHGPAIAAVYWNALASFASDALDHAWRLSSMLGVTHLATTASVDGAHTLATACERQQIPVAVTPDHTAGFREIARLLAECRALGITVDLATWSAAGHGPVSDLIRAHGDRIVSVSLLNVPLNHLPQSDVVELAEARHATGWPGLLIVSSVEAGRRLLPQI